MDRKIMFSLMTVVFLSLIFTASNFADAIAHFKDGRPDVKGKLEQETLDYIVIFEPDTQWRVGLWKNLLSSVEVNGVVYDDIKQGEMLRPAPAAVSQELLPKSEPAMAPEPAQAQSQTIQIKQDDSSSQQKKSNPINAWLKSLFGGSGKKE